ncbi:MAG: GNAT family N-acetyltransferase, partial [Loktanella sp.]|nr:GNAT family N-acetyltransferase [Loktanella sp.]
GMVGTVNELWVRPSVRGRGLGSDILLSVSKALSSVGLKALQLEVDRDDDASQRLFARARFELRDRFALMTREA